MDTELSMDARVLVAAWFSYGPRSSVKVGGKGAQSVLTARAKTAMDELVAGGYVTAEEFNRFGRMLYTGTDKVGELPKFDFTDMEKFGQWSPTEPNPDREP